VYVDGGNDDDKEAVLAAVLAAAEASEGTDAAIEAEETAPLQARGHW